MVLWNKKFEKKKFIISPLNDQFIFKDGKFLLGKSDSSNDEFDNLLFVRRDIEEFSIPSNIKIISPFAFDLSEIKKKISFHQVYQKYVKVHLIVV